MRRIAQYLKFKEAAAFLGISTSSLEKWKKQGMLREYRHPQNGYRLFKLEELAALKGNKRKEYDYK